MKKRKARPHGETWETMRRLYLKYPIVSVSDLAEIVGISRARANVCVSGLKDERERLRRDALETLRKKEGL